MQRRSQSTYMCTGTSNLHAQSTDQVRGSKPGNTYMAMPLPTTSTPVSFGFSLRFSCWESCEHGSIYWDRYILQSAVDRDLDAG